MTNTTPSTAARQRVTVGELAARLYPPPPIPARWVDAAQRRAVLGSPGLAARPGREAVVSCGVVVRRPRPAVAAVAPVLGSRDLHIREAHARVSAIMGELVRAGLVEKLRPPVVAEWFRERVRKRGMGRAIRRLVFPDDMPAEQVRAWSAMVHAAEESPGTWRPGASGAEQETYAALVGVGVITSPQQRWPTVKGIELVQFWNEVQGG